MVKPGHKETEVGIIPENWEIVAFWQCFSILPNNTYSRNEMCENGSIMNIHYGDILVKYGSILNCSSNNIPYLTGGCPKVNNSAYLSDGDVVLADTAEDETVGKTVEIYNIQNKKIVSGLHTIPCHPNVRFAKRWLGYYMNSALFHDQLLPFITGTKVSAIAKNTIANIKILRPPMVEQQKIAEALSDMDELIASLEKLIAKKKTVKQGAMQELLTGKKRLPGFNGEWYTTTIGAHCVVYDGTHQTPHYVESGIPFYSVENVTANNFAHTKYITEQEYNDISARCKIEQGDILMTRIGSIGECKYVSWSKDAGFYVSLALIKCIDIDGKFLAYYSNSPHFLDEIKIRSLLTAIPQKINLGPISEIVLEIPKTVAEQQAIASVLSDMDAEIETLEQKLAKCLQTKQGMMQQLLTGKLRLV